MGTFTGSLAVEPFGGDAGWSLRCSQGGLRDRFRGALLGLSLAPVAPDLTASQGLTQSMLTAAVPKLLRYFDSWERRRDWFLSVTAANKSVWSSEPIAWVQVLMLGDFLEGVLSGSNDAGNSAGLNAELTRLRQRLTHYDLTTSQHQYYLETLAALGSVGQSSNSSPFAGAILSALHYPESYGLAVQAAAAWGGIAPAIAGLLAGARGGQSCIPVLWLLPDAPLPDAPLPDRPFSEGLGDMTSSAVIAIADQLFAQWAGMQ
jgi:hypothetical protein